MSTSEGFVVLRPSMIVPVAAFEAVAACERLGHRLLLHANGRDVVVEQSPCGPPLNPTMLATLRRWKPHVRMLISYTACDLPPADAAGT